jgi:hypothetical protein
MDPAGSIAAPLAGWLHYLAFDLLIGTWEARDAREHGIRPLLIPCLFVTFMFGSDRARA